MPESVPGRTGPMPMGAALTWLAEQAPDAPAIVDEDRSLTRGEVDREATRLAHLLAAHGVRRDDRVMMTLPNGAGLLLACAAAWKLGATPLPVSARTPPDELSEIARVAEVQLVIGGGVAPTSTRAVLDAGSTLATVGTTPDPLPDVVGTSWKAVLSGGSSGRPKIVASAAATTIDPGGAPTSYVPRGGRQLVAGPLFHSAPFTYATRGPLTGQQLVVLPRFDPARVLTEIAAHRITFVGLVPTMMRRILLLPDAARDADLSSLEVVLHVGARCPEWLKRAWIDLVGAERLVEVYGGSEAVGVAVVRGDEWLDHPGTVGRPRDGTEFRVVRPDGSRAATGEPGELLARRRDGTSGYHYLGAPDATRDGGWHPTGDLGRVDAQGYLYVIDRVDDMIITGGANVFPAEVEAVLDAHPAVRTSVVVGIADDDLGSRVHAFVETADAVTGDDLLTWAASRLEPEKRPRTIEVVPGPLRNEAGKVRRRLLAEPPAGPELRRGADE